MKLSATMEKVMKALNEAGYYYKDVTSTETDKFNRKIGLEKFHTIERTYNVGYEGGVDLERWNDRDIRTHKHIESIREARIS